MTPTPMYSQKSIAIVSGVGNGSGTGNATARHFARNGYRIALIARRPEYLEKAAAEINTYPNGEAAAFPIKEYSKPEIRDAFKRIKAKWPGVDIRVAIYNTGHRISHPFMELSQADIDKSIKINILGGFAFAQEAILSFRELPLNSLGTRGVLIFTSATAAWRGNKTTAAFSAGKHGVRGLSQSLNKEFGKHNIHVAHAIIDGAIKTDVITRMWHKDDDEWANNEDVRLIPDSIAKAYWYLAHQDRSAWTWELDLRPAHENW